MEIDLQLCGIFEFRIEQVQIVLKVSHLTLDARGAIVTRFQMSTSRTSSRHYSRTFTYASCCPSTASSSIRCCLAAPARCTARSISSSSVANLAWLAAISVSAIEWWKRERVKSVIVVIRRIQDARFRRGRSLTAQLFGPTTLTELRLQRCNTILGLVRTSIRLINLKLEHCESWTVEEGYGRTLDSSHQERPTVELLLVLLHDDCCYVRCEI